MQSCGQLHKSLILSQPGRSIIPVVSLKRPVASLTARHSLRILAALRRLSPQKPWFLVHSPLFAHVANPLCFLSCLRACAKRLFAPQCVQYTRISSERNRNFWKIREIKNTALNFHFNVVLVTSAPLQFSVAMLQCSTVSGFYPKRLGANQIWQKGQFLFWP